MRKVVICLAVFLMLAGCSTPMEEGYRQVNMQEALSLMEKENEYLILDVRTRKEYAQGHIPGAICVPNEEIGEKEVPELPEKDRLSLVYCRSGNRSKQAARKLVALGYHNIVEFGGINDWPGEIVSEEGI